ncbi:MFS general substrate transporter [Apiospora kogelbergensis]|uniref:MFS general substrate transporter n=1 Tax=Apiospora kogelbergensis TaxID=1337665 RepID=UPI00312E21C9
MPRTAHRHEQPLRKEEDDGAKGNEGLAASITCPSYYHIDNTADQSYALGAMRISSSSSRNDELSPTSTTTMTHQRTNTQGSKDSPDGGDFKSGGVAQRPDHTFYVDGEVGDDNAVLASTNNIDGEEGSIRAGVVYRTYKRRWFGLVQLTLLNIIVSWDWITFSPVSQFSATYYNVSESAINWLSTGFLFVFVATSPIAIYILHKGPKLSIVTASVLVLVGNWIRFAGSHSSDGGNFGVVMFGQVLTGAAQTFVLSAPTTYSDLWFTSRGRCGALCLYHRNRHRGSLPLHTSCAPTPAASSGSSPKEPLGDSIRRVVRIPEIWMILIPFGVYVGFFNSISTILNQTMMPHGYTSDEAGIAGAVLIVVGLVSSAISSPILDRTKAFLLAIKVLVPVIGLMYLVFIWMPGTHDAAGLAGPYVVLAVLGAASFSLVPVALEFLTELAHPCSPEVTSTVGWASGQLLGGCFILISDALKAGPDANPPLHMEKSLIFHAVVALAVVPLPLCLGLFGRSEYVDLRRTSSDKDRSPAAPAV